MLHHSAVAARCPSSLLLAHDGVEDFGQAGAGRTCPQLDLDGDARAHEADSVLFPPHDSLAVVIWPWHGVDLPFDVPHPELEEVSALVPGDVAAEEAPVTLCDELSAHGELGDPSTGRSLISHGVTRDLRPNSGIEEPQASCSIGWRTWSLQCVFLARTVQYTALSSIRKERSWRSNDAHHGICVWVRCK